MAYDRWRGAKDNSEYWSKNWLNGGAAYQDWEHRTRGNKEQFHKNNIITISIIGMMITNG